MASAHAQTTPGPSQAPASPNAQFLVCHVFGKAGPRAASFVPLLRQRAKEGSSVHGKLFTEEEVEEAIGLCGLKATAKKEKSKQSKNAQGIQEGASALQEDSPTPQKGDPPPAVGGGTPTPPKKRARSPRGEDPPTSKTKAAKPPVLRKTATGSWEAVPTPAKPAAQQRRKGSGDGMAAAVSEVASLPEQPPDAKQPSVDEPPTGAAPAGGLGQAAGPAQAPAGAAKERLNLNVKGSHAEVRANPPRLQSPATATAEEVGGGDEAAGDLPAKRPRRQEEPGGAGQVELGLFGVPKLPPGAGVPRQTLRISAGRAAAAAGLHPFTDVGDMFLEFVYQDLPDLLIRDAEAIGAEVVSPELERLRLMEKSGKKEALEAALRAAAAALAVESARESQRTVAHLLAGAEREERLTPEEAAELQRTLEREINMEFGERHEDAAIHAYEARVGHEVYGQQRRVSLSFPVGGPAEALASTLPPLRQAPLPREAEEGWAARAAEDVDGGARAYFRLTGFVDGLVDLPPEERGRGGERGAAPPQTRVVEVKHRIGKIKDPPNLYDVVQLCCYCRVFGLAEGHLVQCLRENVGGQARGSVGQLHVSRLDFREGSEDRKGWDRHILPSLYSLTAAVYATRASDEARLRLLSAKSPEERTALVGEICPHLQR